MLSYNICKLPSFTRMEFLFYIIVSFVYCIILHPVTVRVYSLNLIQNSHSLPNPYKVLAAGNSWLVPQNSSKDDNKLREKTCDQQNSLFCPVYMFQ